MRLFAAGLGQKSEKNYGIILTKLDVIQQAWDICWVWQYGLWSFQAGDTKLERFLHKNQHTQRKLLNFQFWINGELSKIGHHFSNEVI